MPGKSRVAEWQTVTVQRAIRSSSAIGRPDNVRLADDDRVLADQVLAGFPQQDHAPVGRARTQARPLQDQPADVVRMKAVDILVRMNALADEFGVDMLG